MTTPTIPAPSLASISSHNLINYFVPGVLFIYALESVEVIQSWPDNLLVAVVLYYVAGIAVNRFGSIYIKKWFDVFKSSKIPSDTNINKEEKYSNYVNAKISDPEIKEMTQMSDLYKTIASIIILVPVIKLYTVVMNESETLAQYNFVLIFLIGLFLFVKAYLAQDVYIDRRVKIYLKNTIDKISD